MGFLNSVDLDDNKTAAVVADLQNASQPVEYDSCTIQRSLSVLFLLLILCGTFIQLAVIQAKVVDNRKLAILKKKFKIAYFPLSSSISTNNRCFTSYYVIQPYGLILALNRLIIVVVRVHRLSDIAQRIHKFANCTLWSLAIPPILAAFHPTCHIFYVVYSYQRLAWCIYDDMINGLFSLSFKFMQITFVVYLLLVVGLVYHRSQLKHFGNKSPHANRKLMNTTEWRILLTAFSEFVSVLVIMIFRSYCITWISYTGTGRIVYRFTLIFSTFASSVLMMAFNKPLRSIFYKTYSFRPATVHPAATSTFNNAIEHAQSTSC
ncbi:hypothetical protein M3Y95_01147300 [Aphelenchoides besseyi]|nr:hypothetical protein M3Y95_01147300 [Aphelenchoides besseyi]